MAQTSGQLMLGQIGGIVTDDAKNDIAMSKFLLNLTNPNLKVAEGMSVAGTGDNNKLYNLTVKSVLSTPVGADDAVCIDNTIMGARASGNPEALLYFRDSKLVDTSLFPQPNKGAVISSHSIGANLQLKQFDSYSILASSVTVNNIASDIAKRGTIAAISLEGDFPPIHASNVSEQTLGRYITDETNKQSGISQENQVTMVQRNRAAFDDVTRSAGYHHGTNPSYVAQKIVDGQSLVVENDEHNAVKVVGWGTPTVPNMNAQKEFQLAEPLLQADVHQEPVDTGYWIGTNRMHVRPIYGVKVPDPIVIASSKIPYIHSPSGTGVMPLFRKDTNMLTLSVRVHMEGAPLFSSSEDGTGMFSNASAVRHVARNAYDAAAVIADDRSIFYNRKPDLAIPQYFGQGATKGSTGVKSTGWLFTLELLSGTKTEAGKIVDIVSGRSQVYACMGSSANVTQSTFSKVIAFNTDPTTSWQNIGAQATTTETFDVGQSVTVDAFGGLDFDNWFVYAGMNTLESSSSTTTGWRITAQPYTDAPFRNAGAVPRPLDCWAKGGQVSKIGNFVADTNAPIIPGYVVAGNAATYGPNGYYLLPNPDVSMFDLTSGPTYLNPFGMPIVAYGGARPLVGKPTEGQLVNSPDTPNDDTTASLNNNPALIEASLVGKYRLGGFGACRFGKQGDVVQSETEFGKDQFFGPGGMPLFLMATPAPAVPKVNTLRVGKNAIDYFAEFKVSLIPYVQSAAVGAPVGPIAGAGQNYYCIDKISLITATTTLYGPSGTLEGFENGWQAWFVNTAATTNPDASIRPDYGWGSQGALYNRMQSFAISYIPCGFEVRDGGFGYKEGTGIAVEWSKPAVQANFSSSPGAEAYIGPTNDITQGQVQTKCEIDYTTDINGDANNFIISTAIKDSALQKLNNDNIETAQNIIIMNGLQPEGTATLAGNSIIEVTYSLLITGQLKANNAHLRSPATTTAGSLDIKNMLSLQAMCSVLPKIYVSDDQLAVSDAVFASVGMTGRSSMHASGISFFRNLARNMSNFARTIFRSGQDMAKGLSPEAKAAVQLALETKEAKNVVHRMESMFGLAPDSMVPMGRQVYNQMMKSSTDGRLRADWIDDAYRGGGYILDLVDRAIPILASDPDFQIVKSDFRTWASCDTTPRMNPKCQFDSKAVNDQLYKNFKFSYENLENIERNENDLKNIIFASQHGQAQFPVVNNDGEFMKGINLHVATEPPLGKKFKVRKTYRGGAKVAFATNFCGANGEPEISKNVHKAIEAWSNENPGNHSFWIYPDIDQKIYGRSFEMAVIAALQKSNLNVTGAIEGLQNFGGETLVRAGAVTNVENKALGLPDLHVPASNARDVVSNSGKAIEGIVL